MQWSKLPLNPAPRVLRQFAGLWIVFFGGLACWRFFVSGDAATAGRLFLLAFTVGPIGLLFPKAVKPVFVGWLILAFPVGWLVSRAVLVLLFFGIFSPIGVLFRLMGRDLLQLRRQPDRDTYWTRKASQAGAASYLRQY
jgi:hypothetical protein